MATQLSAVSKTVSSATSSGVLTVGTTSLLRVGQIGWLSKAGVESRRIEITEIMSANTFRATMMPRILDDNFARSMPLAYPTTNFLDLSAFNGGANFDAEAQVVSDLYVLPGTSGGGSGTLLDGIYGSITVTGSGTVWQLTDGVYGDVTISGGGTLWNVSFSEVSASWPQTTKRYYVANYLTGSDTNLGYSDVDLPSANAVAVKTIERLRQIVPQLGNGRDLVIVVAGDPSGANLTYLKMDGVTVDDLDFRLSNYRNVIIRTSRTFLNDTADKTILGAATGVTGPDAGGTWTCAAGSTTSIINVASATLPAEPGAIGMRVRFTGNVTAALANQCRIIWMNTSGVITAGRNFSVAPAAGDTFYIERPGVLVNNANVQIHAGAGQAFGQLQTGLQIAGFRALQSDVNPRVYNWQCNELRLSFMELDQFLSMRSMSYITIDHQYFDETGTAQTPGVGLRHSQNRSLVISGATSLIYTDSAVVSSNVIYSFARLATYTIGRGCYFAGRVALSFCGTGATNSSGIALYGSDGGSSQSARHVGPGSGATSSPLNITSTNGRFSGVDISNAGAAPAVNVSSMGGGYLHFLLMTSSAGGNTDVGISLGTSGNVAATGCRVDLATSVTLTGTAGDLRLGDGTIVPYATVRASRYLDNYANSVGNNTGTDAPVTRKTPGILANVAHQAVDPTTPLVGDLWTRTDHRLASRGSDGVTRYAWFHNAPPAIADWALATTRYYAVDFVGGLDTNVGFSDVDMPTAGAVAFKTLTKLISVLPKNGAGRKVVIALKGPTTNTAAAVSYLKPDLVTLDDLDFRGVIGYRYFLARTTQSFLNTTTDKETLAPVLGQVGPNGDSSFSVDVGATINTFNVVGGGLTAKPGLYGMRVRFTGNVTAALANKTFNIWKNSATEIILGFNAGVAPASGDTFFIERPGVIVDQFYSTSDQAGGQGASGFSITFAQNICGIRCSQTTSITNFINGPGLTQTVSFCEFDNRCSIGVVASVSIRESYVDELLANITTGAGLRWSINGAAAMVTGSTNSSVQLFCSALVGGSSASTSMARPQAAGTLWIGSYCAKDFVLQGGKPVGGHGVLIGNAGGGASSFYRRSYFDNAAILPGQSTGIEIRGVDINNCAGKACIRFQSVVHGTLQFWDDIVSTDGGNTDVVITVSNYQYNTLMLGARNEPITATASLGDIRTYDNTIISFATINTDEYVDTGSNRYVGATTARRLSKRTPGVIHSAVPLLAADPTTPLLNDLWARDDNRLALRGTDAITRYAWFGLAPPMATWSAAVTRYYAVDYTSGSDTNLGYSDVDMATAGTVALKTLTRLREILPLQGNGRRVTIAVKGTTTGADIQYLKPDLVTLDDLDLRGLTGYGRIIARTTTNFVNDTSDKRVCGPAFGQVGPNGDSSWTVAVGATTAGFTIAAGALTAEPGLSGMRVRFTGNVTAALANQARMIWQNDGTSLIVGRNFSVAPAAGDTFFIERPGVSVNEVLVDQAGAGESPNAANVYTVQVVGFRARQTAPSYFNMSTNGALGLNFNEFDKHLSAAYVNFLTVSQNWIDEAGSSITTGAGARFAHDAFYVVLGSNLTQFDDFACISVPAFFSLAMFNAVNFTFGAGSVSFANVQLTNCGRPGASGGNNDIGLHSGSTLRTLRRPNSPGSSPPITLLSTYARISADVSNAGAQPCIRILNTVGGSLVLNGLSSRDGGNTGYAVDMSSVRNLAVTVSGTNTLSPTTGEILMAGSFATTWAQVALAEVRDSASNTVGSATAVNIMRKTTGTLGLVPLLAADPTPLVGDTWFRSDNRMALRGTDAVTRYVQFNLPSPPAIADWDTANTRYVAVDPVAGDDTRIGYVDAPHGTSWASSATLDAVSVKTLEEVHQRIMPLNGNKRRLVILIKGNAAAVTPIDVLNKAGTALDCLDVRGVVPLSYYYFSVRASNFMNDAADLGAGARMIAYAGPNGDSSWTTASLAHPVITLSAGSLPTGSELAGLSLRFKGNITAAIGNRANTCKYAPTSGTLEYAGSSVTVPVANDEFFIEKPSVRMAMWLGNISSVSRMKRATISDTYAPWISSFRIVMPVTSVTGPYPNPHFMASVSSCVFDTLTNTSPFSCYLDYANTFSVRPSESGADVSVFNAFRIESTFTTTMYNMGAANRFDLSQLLYFGVTGPLSVKGTTQVAIAGGYVHGTLQLTGSVNEGVYPTLISLGSTSTALRLIIRGGSNGIQLRNVSGCTIRFVSFIDCAGSAIDIVGTASRVDIGECTSSNVSNYGINISSHGSQVVIHNTTLPTGLLGEVNTPGGAVTFAQLSYFGFKDQQNNRLYLASVGDESTQGVKCTASGAIALGDVVRITASGVATKAQADTVANATDVFGCAQNAAVNGASFMVVGAGHGLIGFVSSPPTAPGIAYLSEATAGLCNTTAPATAGTNQKLRIGKLIRPIAGQPLAVCSIYPEYEPVTA